MTHLQPTESTYVKEDMEEVKEKLNKKQWLNNLHKCAPGTNWKSIEAETALNKYYNQYTRLESKSNDVINIADGTLIGQWHERGSNNLAGSITHTAFDNLNNKLYALSSGGSLWKGSIDGLSWEVVNQELRFDNRFLIITENNIGESRIIAAINGIPYYMDISEGKWVKSFGFTNINSLLTKSPIKINNGDDIFYLAQESENDNISLYHSSNYGMSFFNIRNFNTTHLREITLAANVSTSDLFIIEQSSNVRSKIYQWEDVSQKLDLVNANSTIDFGFLGEVNLNVHPSNNDLMAFNKNNKLLKSSNFGETWTTVSTLPVTPWQDGLFISQYYPSKILMPNVEAYRSHNSGLSWEKVNDWIEYYDNPSVKLHADIMHIAEYHNGQTSFIVVANHGGLSISYDGGQNFSNIGMNNLNVSQYYSVKTYPRDSRYIFAGSQDQGIQRTIDFGEGTSNFTQMFSGDFGHIQFTNNGISMWTVFPGGLVLHYDDPTKSNFPNNSYFLESINNDVWLPPIIPSPYHQNSVLLAGGGFQQSIGSHIIELKIEDLGNMNAYQWPFDFSVSGGTLSSLAVNNFNDNIVYAATSTGKFYVTKNRGESFEEKMNGLTGSHYLYGNKILCSQKNSQLLFFGGSGYSNSPIFKSINGGESFVSIQQNLPPTTIHDLVMDPDEDFLFAATEAGPYVFIFEEDKWFELDKGIAPNQTYWSVEYIDKQDIVRFGTYGRGIWDFNLTHISSNAAMSDKPQFSTFPNPVSDYVNIKSSSRLNGKLTIYNHFGVALYSGKYNSKSDNKIDVSNFPIGIYYIIFEDQKGFQTNNFIKI
ncbi:MAG: T9SS type A sorting domain-containing protein [Saprospiraceae bacterium]|nr:T9SS type A sorting domain-containing protein [Saprospiraceae bacterium]